ncbi:MAG: DUF2244 domain-containing protein [Burkholderiales bacterium]|nr:DUF2244 domain-containing protein [Burkholderiales bacterium]MDE2564861.1 DUF2244 domain-containing protein [Burkholderiales bacterium]
MTAALAPSPWTTLPGAAAGRPWLFGREVVMTALPGAPRGLQWLLGRNCSISPRQLGAVYLLLCGVSGLIATFFFLNGATLIPMFTGLELAAVGLALLSFARHAADREVLTLVGPSLRVEQCFGSQVACTEFAADWLRVEPAAGQGSLVQLSARGNSVRVGRFLRPELRAAFALELRQALRWAGGAAARPAQAPENDSN